MQLPITEHREKQSKRLDQLAGRARLTLYVDQQFSIAPLVDGEIGAPLELHLE